MSKPTSIIVTGACGWIGRQVCLELKASGYSVIALDIINQKSGPWETFIRCNIADSDFINLTKDPRICGSIGLIHCAGHAHRPNETPKERNLFYAINRDGSGNVVKLARAIGIERVVYISSIAFYNWQKGHIPNEDNPLKGNSFYAKSKLDGERIFIESGLDWRVVRLATVFGKGDRANFAKLARALARGKFIMPGRGSACKSVVPVDLAARVLVRFLLEKNPSHKLINVALPCAPDLRLICNCFSDYCGFRKPPILPVSLMRIFALFGNCVAKIYPDFPFTTNNLLKLITSTEVDVTRFKACFPDLAKGDFKNEIAKCSDYYQSII